MNHLFITVSIAACLAMMSACGGGGAGGAPVEAQVQAAPAAARASSADTVTGVAPRPGTFLINPPAPQPALDPSLVARVHAELDLIEQVLHSQDDGAVVAAQEALEVILEVRAELKKERSNRLRVRSLLAGLARDVHVVDGANSPSLALGRLAPLI